jgi:hypothetical protein
LALALTGARALAPAGLDVLLAALLLAVGTGLVLLLLRPLVLALALLLFAFFVLVGQLPLPSTSGRSGHERR